MVQNPYYQFSWGNTNTQFLHQYYNQQISSTLLTSFLREDHLYVSTYTNFTTDL